MLRFGDGLDVCIMNALFNDVLFDKTTIPTGHTSQNLNKTRKFSNQRTLFDDRISTPGMLRVVKELVEIFLRLLCPRNFLAVDMDMSVNVKRLRFPILTSVISI